MKTKPILLCLMMISISFAGCLGGNETVVTDEGDPVTLGELPDDWPTYYVATANDLPTCDANTLGRLYYVEADTNFQACMSTGWAVVNIGGTSSGSGLSLNTAPLLSAHVWSADDDLLSQDSDGTVTQHVYLDWYAEDFDGTIASIGVDLDGDNVIDVPLPSNIGLFTDSTFELEPGEWMNGTLQIPLEMGNTFVRIENVAGYECALIPQKKVFVIAIDDDGAMSKEVVSVGFHEFSSWIEPIISGDLISQWNGIGDTATVWGIPQADIDWLDGTTSTCPLETSASNNQFQAIDHPVATSAGSDDVLIRISWIQGWVDLEWAFLSITLFDIEDGTSYGCGPSTQQCNIIEENVDNIWSDTEVIALEEAGVDICGYTGSGNHATEGNSCDLRIEIYYQGVLVAGTSGTISVT